MPCEQSSKCSDESLKEKKVTCLSASYMYVASELTAVKAKQGLDSSVGRASDF